MYFKEREAHRRQDLQRQGERGTARRVGREPRRLSGLLTSTLKAKDTRPLLFLLAEDPSAPPLLSFFLNIWKKLLTTGNYYDIILISGGDKL